MTSIIINQGLYSLYKWRGVKLSQRHENIAVLLSSKFPNSG